MYSPSEEKDKKHLFIPVTYTNGHFDVLKDIERTHFLIWIDACLCFFVLFRSFDAHDKSVLSTRKMLPSGLVLTS